MHDEVVTSKLETIERKLESLDRVLYNGGYGIVSKVEIMWEKYLFSRKVEAAIIILLLGNLLVNIANLTGVL